MLTLRLKVKGAIEFRSRVIRMPRSLPMAIGARIESPGFFPNVIGKKETRIMCRYDHEPWLFASKITSKDSECILSFYHIRLNEGANWGMDHMPIIVTPLGDSPPEFELKCETGYGEKEGPFIFRVKIVCDSCEML